MIRNILFDMGQVLLAFDPKEFVKRLNVSEEDETLLIHEIFRSVEWVMLDHGTLLEEDMIPIVQKRLPEHLHDAAEELIMHWDEPRTEKEEIVQIASQLKENGYQLYLLTNAGMRHKRYWPKCSASRLFEDRVFLSAEHKLLKPDHAFFQAALTAFDLVPLECLFIDDSPANCEAAQCCGIRSIVFNNDAEELLNKLRMHGVKI